MKEAFVFIYARDNEIKALNIEESQKFGKSLKKDGWIHTQTLDACTWIQYLHNDCKEQDLLNEIMALSNN